MAASCSSLLIILIALVIPVPSLSIKSFLQLKADPSEVLNGQELNLHILLSDGLANTTSIFLWCEGDRCSEVLKINQSQPIKEITIPASETSASPKIATYQVGHLTLYLTPRDNSSEIDTRKAFVEVSVGRSKGIVTLSFIVGWIYFAAWSISFYPQIITNWKRKSVTGLNFDFILLNLFGFTFYSIFNVCLYFIPAFQEEYLHKNPRTLIPVESNDVGFSIHAVAATLITVAQCLFYERGSQRVAKWAIGFIVIALAAATVLLGLVLGSVVSKLDYIYFFSYVKLVITIIKYIPQAYFNFTRKSTIGWSIGNILLDFTGGSLSILQMFLLSYNYDDWVNIFGNPTKFGLGFFSILFDILFMLQHYLFYRNASHEEILESSETNGTEVTNENAAIT